MVIFTPYIVMYMLLCGGIILIKYLLNFGVISKKAVFLIQYLLVVLRPQVSRM